MRTEEQVLSQFSEWAMETNAVRAAMLTSSRADPNSSTDFLSDYDIEMFVSDILPFQQDDQWLESLGTIMVRWPYRPRSTFDENWITRLILFDDGVRIDFQITDKPDCYPNLFDYGYKVLIDKDGILTNIPEPTFSKYNVKKPSRQEFETLVNEFWWNATYVPKYLWRDELPFAKSMMSRSVQDRYLKKVIEWYIGSMHNWTVNTGVQGRHFKRYLDPDIWAEYLATFADADINNNWLAFFKAVSLFGKLGRVVGERLGYDYPNDMESEMTEFYEFIQSKSDES